MNVRNFKRRWPNVIGLRHEQNLRDLAAELVPTFSGK